MCVGQLIYTRVQVHVPAVSGILLPSLTAYSLLNRNDISLDVLLQLCLLGVAKIFTAGANLGQKRPIFAPQIAVFDPFECVWTRIPADPL